MVGMTEFEVSPALPHAIFPLFGLNYLRAVSSLSMVTSYTKCPVND